MVCFPSKYNGITESESRISLIISMHYFVAFTAKVIFDQNLCDSWLKLGDSELTRLVVCILEAVLTVSPKKQYLGILMPTTPATAGPE